MEKIFKIDGKLYKKVKTQETWIVKIYDYGDQYLQKHPDDDRKYHRVLFGSEERAIECVQHYEESKDNDIVLEKIVVNFQHILLDEQIELTFNSIEKRSEFFNNKDINDLDNYDLDLIFRIEEKKQKETHHYEHMEHLSRLIDATWNGK